MGWVLKAGSGRYWISDTGEKFDPSSHSAILQEHPEIKESLLPKIMALENWKSRREEIRLENQEQIDPGSLTDPEVDIKDGTPAPGMSGEDLATVVDEKILEEIEIYLFSNSREALLSVGWAIVTGTDEWLTIYVNSADSLWGNMYGGVDEVVTQMASEQSYTHVVIAALDGQTEIPIDLISQGKSLKEAYQAAGSGDAVTTEGDPPAAVANVETMWPWGGSLKKPVKYSKKTMAKKQEYTEEGSAENEASEAGGDGVIRDEPQ